MLRTFIFIVLPNDVYSPINADKDNPILITQSHHSRHSLTISHNSVHSFPSYSSPNHIVFNWFVL